MFKRFILCIAIFLPAQFAIAGEFKTFLHAPPQDDTLMKWMNHAPQDTNTLNVILLRSQVMFRSRPPAEILPYIDKATALSNRLISGATPRMQYIVKKKLSRAMIFRSMVYGYGSNRQAEKERELLMEALKLLQELDIPLGIANVYNNLAASYAGQEKYAEALSYHLKALRIRENLHDSAGLTQSYGGLSEIYFRTKKYKDALKYGNEAMAIAVRKKNFVAVAERLRDIGSVYLETGEYELAKKNMRSALSIADSLDYTGLRGNMLNNLGILHDALDSPDSAIHYQKQAIAVYTELSDGLNLSSATTNLGLALYHKSEYADSRKILLANVDSVKKYNQGQLLELLYNVVVGCDSALMDYKGAFLHARTLNMIVVKNNNNSNEDKMLELRMQYDNEKMAKDHRRLQDETKIKTLKINRARLLMLILAVTLIFSGLIFVLLYRQHKQKAARKTMELEQRLLRSQMNPHFIFNALQAIQNYILNHNQQDSVRYLDSFANLAREVLDHSRVELIPLSKEIELLKNYLELQKLRFMDRFDYHIHISEKINPNIVHLPPMLSQPFIENAIEHGLSDVESGGMIKVSFDIIDQVLHMEISDNGSGMQKNDLQLKKHNSLAIEITKERIMLLNKKNKRKSSFIIMDADPAAANRKGVKVVFRIPVPLTI